MMTILRSNVRSSYLFLLIALLISNAVLAPIAAACVGDCSGDRGVTVDEITTLIAIATAQRPITDCSDPNGDGAISIEEIVGAVGNLLGGCQRGSRRFLYPGATLPVQFPVELVDVNHDGTTDIVAPGLVLINNGHASFSLGAIGFQWNGEDLAVGSFDDDSKPDFVTTFAANDYVTVRLSSDESTFTLATGDGPVAVVAADVDGDGDADIVTANAGDSTLTIYLGDGHGGFARVADASIGFVPALLEAAELTGDDELELVIASRDSDSLLVFRYGGSASSTQRLVANRGSAASGGFSQIVVHDIDLDGRNDLVTVTAESGVLGILLGNGDGTFRAGPMLPQFPRSAAIAVGDFNGDGSSDMAIGSASLTGEVGIILGGRACNGVCSTFTMGAPITALVAGELTGDGHVDLMIDSERSEGSNGPPATIVEGNGDGTFQAQRRALGGELATFWHADFDRDHSLDAVRLSDAAEFRIFLRAPDGHLQESDSVPLPPYPPGGPPLSTPEYLALGDFDGDGANEFAEIRTGEGVVNVYWGNGDGTFANAQPFAVGMYPRSIAAGDFNGDGREDLATANFGSDDLTLLLAKGSREFERRTVGAGDGPYQLAIADIDGDDRSDIIAVNERSNDISIRLAGEMYSYAVHKRLRLMRGRDGVFSKVLALDLNGDALADLVADAGGGIFIVLLGNGDGSFRKARTYPVSFVFFGPMQSGDANGDGHPDLFIPDLGLFYSLWLGDGTGEFAGPLNFSAGASLGRIRTADVNGDSVADVLASNFYSGTAEIHGAGCDQQPAYTLGSPQTLARSRGRFARASFLAADFNGDGRLDLATGGLDGTDLILTEGSGQLAPPQPLPGSGSTSAIAAAYFDADGYSDLVIANPIADSVSIYSGIGEGAFSAPRSVAVGDEPIALLVADLNSDLRLDIVTLNRGDKSVTALLQSAAGEFESRNFAVPFFQNQLAVAALVGADFDENGTFDLAIPHASGIGILPGLGDGGFGAVRTLPGLTAPATAIVIGDFNEDGNQDLASTDTGTDVTILRGRGDGTFEIAGRVFATASPLTLDTAELDGDGHLDLVVGPFQSEEVTVLFGRGDGTFPVARRFAGSYGHSLKLVDFDADGDADVMSAQGLFVSVQAGMFVACAEPHDTRNDGVSETCALCPPDGSEQILNCNFLTQLTCP